MSLIRIGAACGLALILAGAAVNAHGPYEFALEAVPPSPAYRDNFAKGDVGVVRPTFQRRYLIQAYRVFSGKPPLPNAPFEAYELHPVQYDTASGLSPDLTWKNARDRALGEDSSTRPNAGYVDRMRRISAPDPSQFLSYQYFGNCLDDALVTAVRTLRARSMRFGEKSAEVRDWVRAQDAVFENCGGTTLVLPPAAPRASDPLIRSDRAYQTASAYFYATQYEEAARRFREIGADATSPWQPYGRYLAARATIRLALVPAANAQAQDLLAAADAELQAVAADPRNTAMHAPAQGLRDFVSIRLHPVERVHALSTKLSSAPQVSDQDIVDYRRLMDHFVGDTDDFPYATVTDRAEIVAGDDLTDWLVALQGSGEESVQRIIERWDETKSVPWLVAALWRVPVGEPVSARLLNAARAVERSSPAFPTVAFLRVRTLNLLGRADEGRALLDTIPNTVQPGFNAETINLFRMERLQLATTLERFLLSAPRVVTTNWTTRVPGPGGIWQTEVHRFMQPILDDDAGIVLNRTLPLDSLVEASLSNTLPNRLRVRVATMALTRAILLDREDAALRVAPVFRRLAPSAAGDLDRYVAAPDARARHIAALMLLLRTPGMRLGVRTQETETTLAATQPGRSVVRGYSTNWWCSADPDRELRGETQSWVVGQLYPSRKFVAPDVVSPDQRAAREREQLRLDDRGSARIYLATETMKWSRETPNDPRLAEALARVVDGWRWSWCPGDPQASDLPRQAFQALHRSFPASEWTRRTPLWYQ